MQQRLLYVLAAISIGAALAVAEEFFSPRAVAAHGGGLDSLGCHNDRQRENYHCHQGPLAGRTFSSQTEARAALARTAPTPDTTPSPQPAASASTEADPVALPYDRALYRHWIDTDGDCQDTRQEVLIAESLEPAMLDAEGCRVISGRWLDPYTGQIVTDPSALDVDHFIPLAEAHRSGGDRWTPEQRERYANDVFHVDTLMAVSASANRSKGDRDPAEWLPPNESYRCTYVRTWVVLKATWELAIDAAERRAIAEVLRNCP